ncbi:MAG: hypothetical protein WBW40_01835, partial [Thermoplasmata archaeon]
APVPRRYLAYSLLLVGAAVVLLELLYAQSPVPPGVDSGDWIQRSFAWVGLTHAPLDAIGSPYLYNPMIFPILGAIELGTGNPLTTGFIFGGFLLGVYGLSLVFLARRFFGSGPFQFLFVGLGLFNGTVLQMLFWGGYPNFLALALVNLALVALLAFLRTLSTRDGLLLYAAGSLVYLTHELTFVIFVASLGLLALFLIAQSRRWFTAIFSPGNVFGLVLLASVVVGYIEVTKLLAIPHPGYIGSNPAAFYIDNIGEFFRPLGTAPLFSPMGTGVTMTPDTAVALLGGAGLLLTASLAFVAHRRPAWADLRVFLATAVMVATLAVPIGGYLVHVDTDYTRFVYFVPLPVSLLVTLTAERALATRLAPRPLTEISPTPPSEGTPKRPVRRRVSSEGYAALAVALVLALIVANVTIPVAVAAEQANTGTDHDAQFLAATAWLADNPTPGSVLTTAGAVRWTEAETTRGAFDIGPTWLLFESWQIVNAEEAYWALNSAYTLTNNVNVLSYSGFNLSSTAPLSENPMYAAYIEGIQYPLVRLNTTGLTALASTGGLPAWVPAWGVGATPTLSFPNGTVGATITYSTPEYGLFENGTVPASGPAWMNFTVIPRAGATVEDLEVSLLAPPLGISFLHPPTSGGVSVAETTATSLTLDWNGSTTLGQLPGTYPISSTIQTLPAPAQTNLTNASELNGANMEFPNPDPSSPFTVALAFSTAGTSNPAVVLPPQMTGWSFLAAHDIRFLLIPNQSGFTQTVNLYRQVYHFSVAYSNPEWMVLEA